MLSDSHRALSDCSDTQAKLTGLCLGSLWDCWTSSSSLAVSVNNHKKMFSSCLCAPKLHLTDKLVHCRNGERWGLFSTNLPICLSYSDLVRLENVAQIETECLLDSKYCEQNAAINQYPLLCEFFQCPNLLLTPKQFHPTTTTTTTHLHSPVQYTHSSQPLN